MAIQEGKRTTHIGIVALGERAKSQLAEVTGFQPVAVTGIFRDDDNVLWHVMVDMLEMSRIPTATDLLGEYEAILGEDGDMVRFERVRSRLRGDRMEEEEVA